MAAPQSPLGSRRRLGAELRRLRLKSGLTLDEVAERMTCSTSKISRLETGKGIPKTPDVSELMRIYGVTGESEREMLLRLVRDGRKQGWWEPFTEGVAPERFVFDSPSRYTALESDATAIHAFDSTVVYGLLQTADYARSVLNTLLSHDTHTAAEIERLVDLRVTRQAALTRRDPSPPELVVVLDEAVLARPVGGPEVMVVQLERLRELSALPQVTIRVLPFAARLLRAHTGRFVVLTIPEELGNDVVYVEGGAGEAFLEHKDEVSRYRGVFDEVTANASEAGPETVRVIEEYIARHSSPNGKAPVA